MDVKSPITGCSKVKLVRTIDTAYIIELYRNEFSVDVSRYFTGHEVIFVYECGDTGYQFYYPFEIAGEEALYEKLQQFPWYYSEGKTEHVQALDALDPESKVLEIGSGNGIFLRELGKRNIDGQGLELSSRALEQARMQGLHVIKATAEEYAVTHGEEFDAVVSFQVLEHVVNVRSFITACLAMLKPNGLLILSVPNNEAAYHKNHDDPLNLPPHHMGLWGTNSLLALQRVFPLLLVRIATDTSTPPFWVKAYASKAAKERLRIRFGALGVVLAGVTAPFIRFGAEQMIRQMPGQTVTAYFRKITER